jgi:ribose 5-phosphate isomerase RpiB
MAEIIPIGSDQAVYQVKERLVEGLRVFGHEALDLGTRFADGGLARRLDKDD